MTRRAEAIQSALPYVAVKMKLRREQGEKKKEEEHWVPHSYQIPPQGDDWDVWMLLGGRGCGKTEGGARYVLDHLRKYGKNARVGVGAATNGDARDTCAEGATGLVAIAPDEFPIYNRSLNSCEARHIGGGYVRFMGSEEPNKWNGPNWSLLWADELALWNEASWHQAAFGVRLGAKFDWHPRTIVTTTPKSRQFVKDLMDKPNVKWVHATTYDNPDLSKWALRRLEDDYAGTPLGQQELMGEFISWSGLVYPVDVEKIVRHPPPLDDIKVGVVGLDYGMVHPFAMSLVVEDLRGTYWQLDEFYKVAPQDEEWMDKLAEWFAMPFPIDAVACDPSSPKAFVPTLQAAQYPAYNADNDLMGIRIIEQRLKKGGLFIAPGNPSSIMEFPRYVYKARPGTESLEEQERFEDKVVKQWDDLMDARRYAVMWLEQRGADPTYKVERRFNRPSFLGRPARSRAML